MKRLVSIFLAMGALCLMSACNKNVLPQADFPLDETAITAALETAGLTGEISESETTSAAEDHVLYVVRSTTETYAETISRKDAQDHPSSRVLVASAAPAIIDGKRTLYTVFEQKDVSNQFAWEDWKEQILFATLLYGGFQTEEEVYQTLCSQAIPEAETPSVWDARLSGGYC
ncbi:MAG: hypothetical protein K2P41_07285 [Lachnospiraceae bacterium]|nr:hypothetical protein [Lachnospiraceae bacterium]